MDILSRAVYVELESNTNVAREMAGRIKSCMVLAEDLSSRHPHDRSQLSVNQDLRDSIS